MKLNVFFGNEKAGALESTENLNIKKSVISKIFDEFKSKSHNAFAALKADEKVSKVILDLISDFFINFNEVF